MQKTNIPWASMTWNPVHGCSPISEGCARCYAERMARRLAGRCGYPPPPDHFKVTLRPDRLLQPLKVRQPSTIFVCSMGDLFHPDVDWDFIAQVLAIMEIASWHFFLILTKRPANMTAFMIEYYRSRPDPRPLPNLGLGVTVETQEHDWRIDELQYCPAALRFVSAEPLLGPLSLWDWLAPDFLKKVEAHRKRTGHACSISESTGHCADCGMIFRDDEPQIDWLIVGGETGPGARPLQPDWVRRLRDQAVAANIPFFFERWGGSMGTENRLDGKVWSQTPPSIGGFLS